MGRGTQFELEGARRLTGILSETKRISYNLFEKTLKKSWVGHAPPKSDLIMALIWMTPISNGRIKISVSAYVPRVPLHANFLVACSV